MKNILIAYTSWTGSTKEIADHIAQSLNKTGMSTTVVSATEAIELHPFDLIIVGTSIHAGRTTASFKRFLSKYESTLSQKQVAFFVSCANMMNDTDETRAETFSWLEKTTRKFQSIKPISIGLFGGATITSGEAFQKLNIFIQRIIRAMEKKMVDEYGKTDFRDWEKIESWAFEIAAK